MSQFLINDISRYPTERPLDEGLGSEFYFKLHPISLKRGSASKQNKYIGPIDAFYDCIPEFISDRKLEFIVNDSSAPKISCNFPHYFLVTMPMRKKGSWEFCHFHIRILKLHDAC